MWEQYKRTFLRMQIAIVLVSATVYFLSGRRLIPAVLFVLVMEAFSFAGAAWGSRLKGSMKRSFDALPLRPPN